MSKPYKDKSIPISISRQISQKHPFILDLERINTRTFPDLRPKTISDDKVPFAKPSSMSQPPAPTATTAVLQWGGVSQSPVTHRYHRARITPIVRISRDWPVWSRCPNLKVNGQENSIEFPLDSCPDFILLYMVCAQWLSKQALYDSSTDPSSYLHHWLPKHGESNPTSPCMGQPALLHPRQSPVHRFLFLQSSECLLPPSTSCTTPRCVMNCPSKHLTSHNS